MMLHSVKEILYILQGARVVSSQILNAIGLGLDMAVNKYEILHWWLLMTGNGESFWWQILFSKSMLSGWMVLKWLLMKKSANCIVMNKHGIN